MYDLIVIGGGPAGLAAAEEAAREGVERILIIERDCDLGGILNQCIHNGFGLHYFKEELTGPEYAERFIEQVSRRKIEVLTDAMVLSIAPGQVELTSVEDGYQRLNCRAIILAMGCRERTRGAIAIPGTRPAGILTAGTAQRYVNIEGYQVGRRVLILGSGDIGLIMARRMVLEGAKVLACVELLPYSGGLTRNIVQCLNDFDIPLYLSHTITEIRGRRRVEQAVVAQVDERRRPIPGTERIFDVDTILLSVGLIPENELSRAAGIAIDPRTNGPLVYENMETSKPGIFACGNAVHVHDLVDFVTEESQRAGRAAAAYLASDAAAAAAHPALADVTAAAANEREIKLRPAETVAYTVPQHIRPQRIEKALDVFFRVRKNYGNCRVLISSEGEAVARYRRERLVPGEMAHLSIPRVILERVKADELEVRVEEVSE